MENSSVTSQQTPVQPKRYFASKIKPQSLLSAQIPVAILLMSQYSRMIHLFLSILIHATTMNLGVERNVVHLFWNHDAWTGIQYTFQSSPSLPLAPRTGWVACCHVLGLKRRWTMPGHHWQTGGHPPKKWRTFLMLKSYETSKVSMASILVLVVKKVDMSFPSVWITSILWVTNRLGRRNPLAWYCLSVSTFLPRCNINWKTCFCLASSLVQANPCWPVSIIICAHLWTCFWSFGLLASGFLTHMLTIMGG